MADLRFKREKIESLLAEVGFSDIESSKILFFEDPDFFRTTAFLNRGCSREIFILIECLGDELAIHMQNNIDLQVLKNSRQIILQIEKGKIHERDGLKLNAFNSKSVFYEANEKLTRFVYLLKKSTLQ